MPVKSKKPYVSLARGVEIFRETVSIRQICCNDEQFFTMEQFWTDLERDIEEIKIHQLEEKDDDREKRAGVIHFAGMTTLIVSRSLMSKARRGSRFVNFTLAHELAHVILGHHDNQAKIMNFTLSSGEVRRVAPKTIEEYEADLGAVFLQCGVSLLGSGYSASELAAKAYSETSKIGEAMTICRLNEFREQLEEINNQRKRIAL